MAAGQDGGADARPAFPRSSPAALPVVYPVHRLATPARRRRPSGGSRAVTLGHLTAAADRRRPVRGPAGAGAAGRRIRPGRRARPAPARPAGGADRRDGARRPGSPARPGSAAPTIPRRRCVRIDAWLCDLKDFAIKDGLHVYGRGAPDDEPERVALGAQAERAALLAALDGRRVRAGPVGRAGARPDRRAADRAQPLRRRPAHHADADRLRPRQGRRPTRCCAAICRSTATGRARW